MGRAFSEVLAAASVSRIKSRISGSSKAFDSAQNPDLALGKGLPIARSRRTRLCSRRCGSIQAFRMWMRLQMPWQVGSNFLPVLRSYWSVSRSITPAPTFLLERFTFDHVCPYVPIGAFHVRSRLLFDAQRQTERLAECFVPIPPWVGIANSAFSKAMRLSHSVGSLRDCTFSGGDPDGERGDEGTRKAGEQNRRRGARALLRDHISFAMLSAGSPLGATRPQTCAKEPLALWTLII